MSSRPVEPGTPGAAVVAEEERLLAVVQDRVTAHAAAGPDTEGRGDYNQELLSLRDQIAEAKPEDLGPLVEQMTRIAAVAARRGKGQGLPADPRSPYFAHMRLVEDDRKRDVLIGKRAFIDRGAGVHIVDWRNAPVSRIYYRYEEGDDYDEYFSGGRLRGVLQARRNLAIADGSLRRVGTPDGVYVRDRQGAWHEAADRGVPVLQGGQGQAARPPRPEPRPAKGRKKGASARLGSGIDEVPRADKHLPEIASLIDREQFSLITEPDSGLIVIQGGAGSGKTTVALHRVAFLHYEEPKRFHGRNMLVVVPSVALARYVEGVLPSLDVRGVPVTTYARWTSEIRKKLLPQLPAGYSEETPPQVARVKKHPALLHLIDRYVDEQMQWAQTQLPEAAQRIWKTTKGAPPVKRCVRMLRWLDKQDALAPADAQRIDTAVRRLRRRLGRRHPGLAGAPHGHRASYQCLQGRHPDVTRVELEETVRWTAQKLDTATRDALSGTDEERLVPVDGAPLDAGEESAALLDLEDDAILLRLLQIKHGGLVHRRQGAAPRDIRYEHIVIDEAQDMAAIDVKLLLGATTPARSVTIAGDVSQRLVFDNAFEGWGPLLREVGHEAVEIRPLRLSYRSTAEVMQFALHILGPLADADAPLVARNGAPVQMHRFWEMGEAVAFLADALRSVMNREPTASVALIARHAGIADAYYQALSGAEVPGLRRVRRQEFSFAPGIDVTDVTQVKGLEFDYVVILEASAASYPDNLESRHLMHIAATRAAHQLWLVTTEPASPLLPDDLQGE